MFIRILALVYIFLTIRVTCFTQQLPLNTCGIVNVYDAAGNRLKRVYFCNNGVDPYPAKIKQQQDQLTISNDFQVVDAIYPNPTTGRFAVTFSKALNAARIFITDLNGRVIFRSKANGYKADFDLSSAAAGVYFIRIDNEGNIITKKVIKQ